MKRRVRAILSDFDGVLCKDYFYNILSIRNPDLNDSINEDVFRNKPLMHDRMRGKVNSGDINKHIANKFGIDLTEIEKIHLESIDRMQLNTELIDFYVKLKEKGVKIGILTDNMDCFTEYLVPSKGLDIIFDGIFASNEQRVLKGEEDGKLMLMAADNFQVPMNEILVIDDRLKMKEISEGKGGLFYQFDGRKGSQVQDFIQRTDEVCIF